MTEYTRFQDYFRNNFLPEFEKAESVLKSGDTETLREEFIMLFGASFLLLKYYLQNNGLFQFREKDVLREAFNIEFLEHGEEWMKLEMIRRSETSADIEKAFRDYFFVFVDLKKQFERIV